MSILRLALRRMRALVSGRTMDREMDEEIEFHLTMEREEAMRHGVAPEAAAAQARLAFGGVQRFREEGREARRGRWFGELAGDVRYALRVLRRSPGFTLVAVATLALGIGATTAMFSVVHAVVLRPLPFPDEGSLVRAWPSGGSRAEFVALRERVRAFSSVAAAQGGRDFTLAGEGEPERVVGANVSYRYFETLGVPPAAGRFFTSDEERPNSEPVVVLSHNLWQSRYGGDRAMVGRAIELDGARRRVVGIAPAGFEYPRTGTRLWIPLEIDPSQAGWHWGGYGNAFVARLAPGATPALALDEVKRVARELAVENPVWKPDTVGYLGAITVTPLRESMVRDSRTALFLLLGAVALVLVMTCANVANLLIVRGATRSRELAIRTSLGAGTGRLIRQLLTESVVLAVAGGVAGLAVAAVLARVLVKMLPPETPRLAEAGIDPTVLAFTAGTVLLSGIAFGVAPARRGVRSGINAARAGHRATSGPRERKLAGLLVSVQVAVAVVLVVSAGLLVRSLSNLVAVDPGFEANRTVSLTLNPPRATYDKPALVTTFVDQLLERVGEARGVVEGAAVTSQLPFEDRNEVMAMWVDGFTTDPNKLELFEVRRVTPDFFRVMGIPMRSGRGFGSGDVEGSAPVAVISQTAATKYWSGKEVLQGRIRFPWPGWMNVVGVVGDVRSGDLRESALPTIYVPFHQAPQGGTITLAARTRGLPGQALALMRDAARAVGPTVAISDAQPVTQLVTRSLTTPRVMSILLLSFGAMALLLGGVGTFGLVAYSVAARRNEFAVRTAVGAGRMGILGLVMVEGMRLTGTGILVGLLAAFGLTRLLRGMLYGVQPGDAVSFAVAPIVLGITAMVACALPAWRAARVAPHEALRAD